MESRIETDNNGFPSGHTINDYSPCYAAKFSFDPPVELKKNVEYRVNIVDRIQPFNALDHSFVEAVSVNIFGSKINLVKINIMDNKNNIIATGKLSSFRRIFFDIEIKKFSYAALWNLAKHIFCLK